LKIGGTTRITTGAVALIASVTNGTWRLRCGVTTRTTGGSGTQIANCIFEMTGATIAAPGQAPMQTSSTWTVDTTATNAIDLQATWSTATGSPTITATNIAAWIPGAPVTSVNTKTGAVALTLNSSDFANEGTATTVLHGNAAGNPVFGSIVSNDMNITTTSCTNQLVSAISAGGVGTCHTVVQADLPATTRNRTIGCNVGDPGNSSALTTSSVCYFSPTFACTISRYTLGVDAGTVTVKFWKIAAGTALPTISNSINTSGVAISTGTVVSSTTVSDFTSTTVTANDILAVQPTAVATAKWLLAEVGCDQ
jgi:hypothetical protein